MPYTATPDKFKVNDRFFRAMPSLSSEDYKAMAEDIKKRGVQKAIDVLPDMTIIDGHQRHTIVLENPQAPQEIPYIICPDLENETEEELLIYIIGINLFRRHLTSVQKAVIGWRMANELGWPSEAEEKMKAGVKVEGDLEQESCLGSDGRVSRRIAKEFGINHDAVQLVKRLKDKEEFDTLSDLTNGQITMEEASNRLRQKEGKEDKSPRQAPLTFIINQTLGMPMYIALVGSLFKKMFSPSSGDALRVRLDYLSARKADQEDLIAERDWKPMPFREWTCAHGVVGGCWRCYPEANAETAKRKKTSAHKLEAINLPIDRKEIGGFTILQDKEKAFCRRFCTLYDEATEGCNYEKGLPIPEGCKLYQELPEKKEEETK